VSVPASGKPPAAAPATDARAVGVAVLVTLVTQALASLALTAPSVIVPVAAADLGVRPEGVGVFVSVVYVIAIAAGLITAGMMRRYGPMRLCQACLLLVAAGMLCGGIGHAIVIPLCALLIGVPYGVINPVSGHILARRTPQRMMSLVFSLKQTGVPLGGMLAGALLPLMLLAMRWELTLAVIAVVCVVVAVAFQPLRASYDAERDPRHPLRFGGIGAPVVLAWRNPRLRDLAIASGSYSFMQVNVLTFLVSFLNLEVGYSLVAAGLALAVAQLAGVVGRVMWGAVADRWLAPHRTLAMLGIAAAVLLFLASVVSDAWPFAAVLVLASLIGGTAIAWNGVHFAELARRAPHGDVGTATGGVQFYTFGGALLGPLAFSALVAVTGSYAIGFKVFAILPLLAGLYLLRHEWRGKGA
jgi:MFS family permease